METRCNKGAGDGKYDGTKAIWGERQYIENHSHGHHADRPYRCGGAAAVYSGYAKPCLFRPRTVQSAGDAVSGDAGNRQNRFSHILFLAGGGISENPKSEKVYSAAGDFCSDCRSAL